MMRHAATPAASLALALLAPGCAHVGATQRSAVISALRGYVIAVDANDATAACDLLTVGARRAALTRVNRLAASGQFVGVHKARTCVQAFRDVHPGPPKGRGMTADPLAFSQLDRARVVISGSTATVLSPIVPVVDLGARVTLSITHGAWQLTELR